MHKHLAKSLLWVIPLGFLLWMLGVPLASIIREGLFDNGHWTWEPLQIIFSEPYFQRVATQTLMQASFSALASMGLGLFWAFVLTRYEFPFKRTLQSLTIIPFVLPAVTVALGFLLVYGRQGFLNTMLQSLFSFEDAPIKILFSFNAIILAHAFYNAPIVARLTHAAWERLDPGYEENAHSLGANGFRTFWSVTFPLLLPSIATGGALAFIYSFLSFPIVLTLGGAQYATLEVAIFTEFRQNNIDIGAALALVQIALSLLVTAGYLWMERRYAYRTQLRKPRPGMNLFRNISWKRGLLWFALLIIGLFFASPLVSVFWMSVQSNEGGLSFASYQRLLSPEYSAYFEASPLTVLTNSLKFGLGTVILTLLLGIPLAWSIVRHKVNWLNIFAMLPLAISSIALGLGLLRSVQFPPLSWFDRDVVIIFAHTLLALPFVIRALVPGLRNFDLSLTEAAHSLGANQWQAFFKVELPLLRRSVLVGAAFAFAISIAEISASLMLSKSGFVTLTVAVYKLVFQRTPGIEFLINASAMSVVLMVVTGLVFWLIERSGEQVN